MILAVFVSNPRMKRTLAISLILGGFLSSCYFVDDIFDPPQEKEPTLQEKCESSVKSYLKKTTRGYLYNPYGFGKITIRKPQEIVDLEELEKKQQNEGTSADLDSTIAFLRHYIELNKIERTVDLDHFFTLKDSLGDFTIYETNFILNDTLGVKDLSAKIVAPTDGKYEDALAYFFYEYNIFNAGTYYESRNLSSNFYAFFKSELETKTDRLEKSAFLLHALRLTYEVQSTGAFDQQMILEKLVKEHITYKKDDIENYDPLEFSTLFQTQVDETEEISGYYFFHKFIGTFQGTTDTNVVLVEFNPFYEIDNIYQMDRPFDPYFND